jgi:hypothetical protein
LNTSRTVEPREIALPYAQRAAPANVRQPLRRFARETALMLYETPNTTSATITITIRISTSVMPVRGLYVRCPITRYSSSDEMSSSVPD